MYVKIDQLILINSTIIVGILILATLSLFSSSIQDSRIQSLYEDKKSIDRDLQFNSNAFNAICTTDFNLYRYQIPTPVPTISLETIGVNSCDELFTKIEQLKNQQTNIASQADNYQIVNSIEKDFEHIQYYNKLGPVVTIIISSIMVMPFAISSILEIFHVSRWSRFTMIVGFLILILGMISISILISCGRLLELKCFQPLF